MSDQRYGGRRYRMVGIALVCLAGALSATRGADMTDAASEAFREALDGARQWLRQNPPDGTNRPSRRERMALIQRACDALTVDDYRV
ncbi:MAG: hypothetical protein U1E05_01795, partial [Patescibacteria group bacterium]|nr:hypothetical protein [Patescibacteria group bacterium]